MFFISVFVTFNCVSILQYLLQIWLIALCKQVSKLFTWHERRTETIVDSLISRSTAQPLTVLIIDYNHLAHFFKDKMSNIHMVPQMKIIAAFFQFYIIINFGIWTAAQTNKRYIFRRQFYGPTNDFINGGNNQLLINKFIRSSPAWNHGK